MIKRYFKSNYGYNNTIREGRIYNFTSLLSIKYLLEINRDLVDLTYILKRFFYRIKIYLMKKIINKNIINFIHERELGLVKFNNFIDIYEKKYNSNFYLIVS